MRYPLAVCLSLFATPLFVGSVFVDSPPAAFPVEAQQGKNLPDVRVGSNTFHRRQLANGLRAVAVRDAGEKASVFMVISAGKRQETPATTGLAHLTEHAMYAGTAKTGLGHHDRLIHAMGGESNAFTREDYTLFYDHDFPAEQLGKVLAMEADRLRGLTFQESAVLFERERLRREEARTWKPSDARRELLESRVFRKHNYGAGRLDDKGHTKAPTLSVATIREFYDRFYHPDHTAVVVVGNLAPGPTLDAIEKAFGALPRGPKRPTLPIEPMPESPREESVPAALNRDRCHLVWLVPALGHEDRPTLDVLARVISRQTAADGSPIEALMGTRVDRELFRVTATGPKAADHLAEILKRAREKIFDTEEVAEVVDLLKDDFSSLPLRARPYFSLAGTFGVFEVLGHADYIAGYESAVAAVDADKLLAAARRHLPPERSFTLTFKSTGVTTKPLPTNPNALQRAAEEASAAGDIERAIIAYTRLLEAKPNKMFTVIYLASRGQLYVKKKDYDGAIGDYEAALRVIDYPAVRNLLKEAEKLKAAAQRKNPRVP